MAESTAECAECRMVEEQFKDMTVFPDTLTVHITGIWSKDKASKDRRTNTREKLQRMVNALQNTRGGCILIHLSDQREGDRFLGYFDEFICRLFPNVTEDGEMSADIYNREWLYDHSLFKEHKKFVVLNVERLSCVSTVEFNTKIRNDAENTEPTARCILHYLSKVTRYRSQPKLRGIADLEKLHENRHIELKTFAGESLGDDPSILADHIWYKLKLRDNITSMSKLREGGSFFVGICERELRHEICPTKRLQIEGFQVKDKSHFTRTLTELAKSNLIALDSDCNFRDPPDDLFYIELHPVPPSKCVLEVAVRYVNGIVFYDKGGPRTYRLRDGTIVRMDRIEWIRRLKLWKEK